MTSALLLTEHVSRSFGPLVAVDDVSMQVCPGEVVGLIGANGAGKTTLLRVLLGLLAPTSGRSELLGGEPDHDRRARLGYVPQGLGLYTDLTVRENLSFTASVYGVAAPDPEPSLADCAGTLVGDLPLGLQRRVAFQCALLHHPEVLVLDEPTSGVDAVARSSLWETIREQASTGVGVLVTTHHLQEAGQCDRLLLMSGGRLVAEGSEADVIGGTTAVAVHAEDWGAAFAALDVAGEAVTLDGRAIRVADGDLASISATLREAGLEFTVEPVPATLEERMTLLARL